MTTALYDKQITGRSAWTVADVKDKAGLSLTLTDEHLASIDRLLPSMREVKTYDITRDMFDDPLLNDFIAGLERELDEGRGVAVVAGLTRPRYSREDLERIFWCFGTAMGKPLPQSVFGELISHVRNEPENPSNRSYRTNRELTLHTDCIDLLGLMCLQVAKSGGVSSTTSSIAIHNKILETRPDLLKLLYEGHAYHRLGQELPHQTPITPYKVPVFSQVDSYITCRYIRWVMGEAAKQEGRTLAPEFVEALDYFDEVAASPELSLSFNLVPGDMMFNNNYTTLHARTTFEDYDDPELRRDLLRMWLAVPDPRPSVPEADPYQQPESGGRGGIVQRIKEAA